MPGVARFEYGRERSALRLELVGSGMLDRLDSAILIRGRPSRSAQEGIDFRNTDHIISYAEYGYKTLGKRSPVMSTENDHEPHRHKRSPMNFLLAPFLQIKLALYTAFTTFVFVIVVGLMIWDNNQSSVDLILSLTGVGDEIKSTFLSAFEVSSNHYIVALMTYLTVNILLTIIYTHKIIGPTIAFKRHLERLTNGDYSSRVNLRKGDAFKDLAQQLNEFAESLETEKPKQN